MKDSGIEWIGEIPADWNLKKLKHIFAISSGSTPKSDNLEYWDGTIPWITPADYKTEEKYVYYGRKFLSEKGLNAANLQLIPINSIIFSKRAPIGAVAITGAKLAINQGCISCISTIECDVRYYYYVLSIYTEQFNLLGSGTTFKEISAKDFGDFILPVPSLLFQEKLADYLDRKSTQIDDIIARQKEAIEKMKAYKLSVISEAVTKGLDPNVPMKDSGVEWIGKIPKHWNVAKMKFVASFFNGDRSSKYPSGTDIVDTGVIFVTSNNLGNIILNKNVDTKYITKEKYDDLGGAKLRINDIIFCLRGSVGKCSINKTESEGTIASSLVVIRAKKIPADYLIFVLQCPGITAMSMLNAIGIGSLNLSAEDISEIFIPVPSQDDAKQIAKFLERKIKTIDKMINKKTDYISKLIDYKKSLIYEVVTGKKEV